jgi:hypothetical protein
MSDCEAERMTPARSAGDRAAEHATAEHAAAERATHVADPMNFASSR